MRNINNLNLKEGRNEIIRDRSVEQHLIQQAIRDNLSIAFFKGDLRCPVLPFTPVSNDIEDCDKLYSEFKKVENRYGNIEMVLINKEA